MTGASTGGRDSPANEGAGNDSKTVGTADDPELVIPTGTETNSILIRAVDGNSGKIFIGFGDTTSVDNGFPLQPGDSVSLSLNTDEEPVYFVGETVGDEIRWIATS